MTTANDRYRAETDDHRCTEPLEDENGDTYRICQEPVGTDRVVGGGEFPDPATPPRSPAPGIAAQIEPAEEAKASEADEHDDDQMDVPWPS